MAGLLTLIVGRGETHFTVNEQKLREACPFFHKALSGFWRESSDEPFVLPEDCPYAIEGLIWWIESRDLYVPSWGAWRWMNTYFFADQYLMPDLRDLALYALVEGFLALERGPENDFSAFAVDMELVRYLYEGEVLGDLRFRSMLCLYCEFWARSLPKERFQGPRAKVIVGPEYFEAVASEFLPARELLEVAVMIRNERLGRAMPQDLPEMIMRARNQRWFEEFLGLFVLGRDDLPQPPLRYTLDMI